jgi:hypothetical protein
MMMTMTKFLAKVAGAVLLREPFPRGTKRLDLSLIRIYKRVQNDARLPVRVHVTVAGVAGRVVVVVRNRPRFAVVEGRRVRTV